MIFIFSNMVILLLILATTLKVPTNKVWYIHMCTWDMENFPFFRLIILSLSAQPLSTHITVSCVQDIVKMYHVMLVSIITKEPLNTTGHGDIRAIQLYFEWP